jgi:hypothetical protein
MEVYPHAVRSFRAPLPVVWHKSAMRWSLVVASGLLLVACGASDVQSKRLKDGSWSFTCELPMDACVREVQGKCPHQRFRIIEGTSETRLRDVPPFEQAHHTSRLHLTCTNDGATVLLSLDGAKPADAEAPKANATSCTRGQTRECIGPGACKGGQVCLPDGTGFDACDCGSVTPSPLPAPPASLAPEPAKVEPTPAPATPPGVPPP